jgi:hypothetical protein
MIESLNLSELYKKKTFSTKTYLGFRVKPV